MLSSTHYRKKIVQIFLNLEIFLQLHYGTKIQPQKLDQDFWSLFTTSRTGF